jgi:septal ring factor EnvC (AmiA/AmiB activator)
MPLPKENDFFKMQPRINAHATQADSDQSGPGVTKHAALPTRFPVMKQYLSTALTLACAVLVIALVMVKHSDNAQHESDLGTITDYSNRLDSAHTDIALCNGKILTLSNSLDASWSTASAFSNQLMEAQAAVARDTEQITNLNRRVAGAESENQTLQAHVTDLTNEVGSLTQQLASTRASLDQANKDYALLENRLRIDVAERVVVERKFNNPAALQAQLQNLKQNPAEVISADKIYAGLDVEVKADRFHVITQN